MRLVSTRGRAPAVDLKTAVLAGLAPDGGLYLPQRLEPLAPRRLAGLRGASFPEVSRTVARHLMGDVVDPDALDTIVDQALDFPVPLVPLGDGSRALELFHGPTLAFKDVGARFMARLVRHFTRHDDGILTVLTATSGDTGSAVADAFLGVEGTRSVILFPDGRVTTLQERQFTTLGGNVHAVAVEGSFDDCQRLVKAAFGDPTLARGLRLTSANSINVARLLPQTFYYVFAWARLPQDAPPPLFSTPSGNFGNLAAGLIAHRIGMPARRFIAATNANDVVPEYLRTGLYHPRSSVTTISNAMDVGAPSNFARIQALYDGQVERLRDDVLGSPHSDAETRARIGWMKRIHGYVLDPHSAVAHLGLDRGRDAHPDATRVFLATAHPSKFREVVEAEIGERIPLPGRLAACLERQRRVRRVEPTLDALRDLLLEL